MWLMLSTCLWNSEDFMGQLKAVVSSSTFFKIDYVDSGLNEELKAE